MSSIIDTAKEVLGLAPEQRGPSEEDKARFARLAADAEVNPPKPSAGGDGEDDGGSKPDFSSETAGISSTGNMTQVEVADHGAPGRGSAAGPESQGDGDDEKKEGGGIPLELGSDAGFGHSPQTQETAVEVGIKGNPGRGSTA